MMNSGHTEASATTTNSLPPRSVLAMASFPSAFETTASATTGGGGGRNVVPSVVVAADDDDEESLDQQQTQVHQRQDGNPLNAPLLPNALPYRVYRNDHHQRGGSGFDFNTPTSLSTIFSTSASVFSTGSDQQQQHGRSVFSTTTESDHSTITTTSTANTEQLLHIPPCKIVTIIDPKDYSSSSAFSSCSSVIPLAVPTLLEDRFTTATRKRLVDNDGRVAPPLVQQDVPNMINQGAALSTTLSFTSASSGFPASAW